MAEVIELSSDDDDVTPPVPARTTGKSSADAFDLDAWEPDPAPAPAPPRRRGAGASADGGAASSGVAGASSDAPLDLDDDEALARALQAQYDAEVAASTCPLCKRPQHRNGLYKLGECGHRFCHRCVRDHVQKGLAEGLASEIGCPTCGKQMTIKDVQEMSASAKAPEPPAPAPMPMPNVPAHIFARLPAHVQAHFGFMGGGGGGGGAKRGRDEQFSTSRRVAGTAAATKRLMKELQAIQKADPAGFEVSVPDESYAFLWEVDFFDFEKGTPLAKDLQKVRGGRITLHVAFPADFPSRPPYVRVIRPRFAFRTGHVTIGGSICTEMLTSAGWSSTMTMESVLLSIRQNMVEGGARIASRGDQAYSTEDYSEAEAKDAFDRMMRQHGW